MLESITTAFQNNLTQMLIQFAWLAGIDFIFLLLIALIGRFSRKGNFWVMLTTVLILDAIYIFIVNPMIK